MVQTPRLCLQDLLPTSAYQSCLFLFAYLQASCRSSSLSKHLTCVSRTRSQPQPIEILSMLISRRVVGVFTVQTPHLCLQDPLPTSAYRDTLDAHLQASCRSFHCPNTSLVSPGLTPNFSLSRYSKHFKKHVVSGNQLTSHLQQMTLQPTCQKKWNKTHVTWIKNTQTLRCPLTLHQQCTNLVITSEP